MRQELHVAGLQAKQCACHGKLDHRRDISKASARFRGFVGVLPHLFFGALSELCNFLSPKLLDRRKDWGFDLHLFPLRVSGLGLGFRFVGRRRQSLRPVFVFTIRRDYFTLLFLCGQASFEGVQESQIEGLQAMLATVTQVDDPQLLPANIELEPFGLQGGMQSLLPGRLLGRVAGALEHRASSRVLGRHVFLPCAASIGALPDCERLLELGLLSQHSSFELHLNRAKLASGQTQAFGLSGGVRGNHQVEVERMVLVFMQATIDQITRTARRDVVLRNLGEPLLLLLIR